MKVGNRGYESEAMEMEKGLAEVLAAFPLFEGIAAACLPGLLGCLAPSIRDYARGEIIAAAGEPMAGVGLVAAGRVAVTKENAGGERLIVAVLGPGELFGEMAAFAGRRTWPATVIAQESSRIVFFRPEVMLEDCARRCPDHRRLVANLFRLLALKSLALNRKIEYLSMGNLGAKIAAFLLEESKRTGRPAFAWPLNRAELADFLGVTRPALSRALGRMRDGGVIAFDRARVVIKDPEALRRMMER